MKRQWTPEEANAWYEKQGWLRGFNLVGSKCANRLDMFQKYKSEEKLEQLEKELALAEKIGFNTIRLWSNFDVYYAEEDSYMEIFEKYIELCAKYGQKVMIMLTHEEDLPRGDVFVPKKMGEQEYALGIHFGRIPLTPEQEKLQPKHYMEYPEIKDKFIEMVEKTVSKYAKDERILAFNIWNEPGITIGERSIPLIDELFKLVRSYDPIQPVCADVWRNVKGDKIQTKEEQFAYDNSDIISFHSYQSFDKLVAEINFHKKTNRPLFLTEWLNRVNHNNVFDIYPMLFLSNVSCHCWGFVVGKVQNDEPWPDLWQQWDEGGARNYDFTKWQHDLFRQNFRPYDPYEIELIENFNNIDKKDGR